MILYINDISISALIYLVFFSIRSEKLIINMQVCNHFMFSAANKLLRNNNNNNCNCNNNNNNNNLYFR